MMLVRQNVQNTQNILLERLHDQNRRLNTFPTSMLFLPHESHVPMPCRFYYSTPYFYLSRSYNSYMLSLPRYLCPNYITYRKPSISKPSPTNNDRFVQKNQSVQKKKYKMIKQVYCVKKDGSLNKNPDLTLVDKEKPIVEETLVSSIGQITPDVEYVSNNIAE